MEFPRRQKDGDQNSRKEQLLGMAPSQNSQDCDLAQEAGLVEQRLTPERNQWKSPTSCCIVEGYQAQPLLVQDSNLPASADP